MTNETTASQPKSIGDDAQCGPIQYLHNVCADVVPALLNCGRQRLADLLEGALRGLPVAPAAQASATIQAAPKTSFEDYWWEARHQVRTQKECARQAWDFAIKSAATIQEPVMVAEPVEEGWPTNAMISAGFKAGLSGKIGSGFRAMQAAAPMVADPTGVAVTKEMPAQWLSEVVGPSVDDLSYGQGYRAGWNECRAKFIAYLATVKAVPSEALEAGRKRALHAAVSAIWFEDSSDYLKTVWEVVNALAPELIEELQSDAQAVYIKTMPDAAPLADKTGGGE